MRPLVSNPGSSSLFAWLRGGFTVRAENLMDAVVWYAYSMLGVDYSFQVDCSQLVLIVGFKDQGSLLQVSAASGAAWLFEGWHKPSLPVGLPELFYASAGNLLY